MKQDAILQVIITHEGGQSIANFKFEPRMIETRDALISFCKQILEIKYAFVDLSKAKTIDEINKTVMALDMVDAPKISKLSTCVYTFGNDVKFPKWYNKSNGKVYFHYENDYSVID